MFIFLSKLLPLFFYPIGLVCLLLLLTLLFWKKPRFAKILLIFSFVVLFICGNRYISSAFARTLEWQYSTPDPMPQADVIVVLGGGTEPLVNPRPMVEVNAAGDRVIYAGKLYKNQPETIILISGGDIDFLDQSPTSPAQDMFEILKLMGIPKNTVILQDHSQNTYEDALFSCEIIKTKGYDKVILVTSAVHMPRAVKLFEKQGCAVIPAPTDFTITTASWERLWHPSLEEFFLNLVPSYTNISLFTKTMKEYLGVFAYQLKGWI
ncbi:MAG: Uncharacterized protein FD147_628 [Chloroflexi bacterium]|nr:MAG: Uncharacterized protein FD147_628 [Chloroflexota bacterium]